MRYVRTVLFLPNILFLMENLLDQTSMRLTIWTRKTTKTEFLVGGVKPGVGGNDFWTLGTGTGMTNSILKFRERECEWKIPFPISFPFSGTGMQMENSIPDFREREFGTGIGGRYSREFPGSGIPAHGCCGASFVFLKFQLYYLWSFAVFCF